MIRPLLSSLAAVALMALPTAALAKTVTLNLTGTIASATTNGPFMSGGRSYIQGHLNLGGLTPFDLDVGDIVNATITLDAPYVIPPSGEQLFAFSLLSTLDNGQPTSNSADLIFSNSFGPTGLPSNTLAGACSNCLSTITSGPGTPVSFDGLIVQMTIGQLTPSLLQINGASINYQLSDGVLGAVPEPATWTMLILGFGTVGGAMRRRRVMPATARLTA